MPPEGRVNYASEAVISLECIVEIDKIISEAVVIPPLVKDSLQIGKSK